MSTISDADIARSRADPRFKQVLLAKSLEQLLALAASDAERDRKSAPNAARELREGALMAVQLADRIRAIDEQIARAEDQCGGSEVRTPVDALATAANLGYNPRFRSIPAGS